jgi:hypothetical protein
MGRRLILAIGVLAFGAAGAQGQTTIHRNALGTGSLQFLPVRSDLYRQLDHSVSREYAHKGEFSETIRLAIANADPGLNNQIQYVYLTPRAPIADDLRASIWVRSKRAGVKLQARVVFPRMRNPKSPEAQFTTFLDGAAYTQVNNWVKLDMGDIAASLRRRVQSLRIELGTEVDTTNAYIDQLVLNLFTGNGENQVWLNEVEIGPVIEDRSSATLASTPKTGAPDPIHRASVEINRDQLTVDGKRFFFRAIRLTDTPLEVHKRAGFNAVFLDANAPPRLIDEVAKQEMFAIPTLALADLDASPGVRAASRNDGDIVSRDSLTRFLRNDRILFWYLGTGRGSKQVELVGRAAAAMHDADPQRPIGVNADNGLWSYSRQIDLVGSHRFPLHTSLELAKYRDWLNQRRLLTRPGTFTWTWVQTHLPEWNTSLVYNKSPAGPFDEPIGPQPEQIRLLTYIALSAGCRGIGFWSDRFLADTHQGRDRLLQVALLNLEIEMLEPVLLSVLKPPIWIDTSNPQVKAAVLHGDKGILVLPIWLGKGSQFVPGQSAQNGLKMVVPLVPINWQPWEVTPAEPRSLIPRRVQGGVEVVLPEFNLTTAIVFTGDYSRDGLLVNWQDQCRRLAKPAAEWTIDMANIELEKVATIHKQLEKEAPPVQGANSLLADARQRLAAATAFHRHGMYREAYHEANRAMRPLRLLMRLEWDQAVVSVASPVASPYALSYYSLPRHWAFVQELKRTSLGDNVLRSGTFEGQPDPNWTLSQSTLDEVNMAARLSTSRPHEGAQCLELLVTPKSPVAPAALERTFLSVTSPEAQFPPGAAVRISGWIRIPQSIVGSVDGAMMYDSVGGEPLAIRLTDASDWKQFTLYRKVPASGKVSVTLAMTGLGSALFDDVRIEPMVAGQAPAQQPSR